MSSAPLPTEHSRLLDLLSPQPGQPDWASVGVLSAILDRHFLSGGDGLAAGQLEPLFRAWWPDLALVETLDRLREKGLLSMTSGQRYRVPEALLQPLADVLTTLLNGQVLSLPKWSGSPWELLAAFDAHCLQELSGPRPAEPSLPLWGGTAYTSAGRTHLLLFRPTPLYLEAHPDLYILILCQLPQGRLEPITDLFVASASLRQRVALYDLGKGQKMNLTRSDLFIHFERFLRWTYGLRIAPSPELTQGLIGAGILVLEKA